MRQFGKLMVAAMGALSLAAVGSATVLAHDGQSDGHRILEFHSMTPVTGAAVGAVNNRGLTGGGKAWAITSGSGEVDRNGHVMVSVTGLVTRHHVIVNVSTGLFAASSAGVSTIDGTVALPRHCKQPILFVTSPGGSWFAMSNPRHGDEDDD